MSTFKFLHPTTVSVIGPTLSGKTHFVIKCILESKFSPMPDKILWVYAKDQQAVRDLESRLPNFRMFSDVDSDLLHEIRDDPNVKKLVVLDDQMSRLANSEELSRLFTEDAHHCNTTVMMLMQNPFPKGKVTLSH
jgi:hypothetical protein